MSYPSLGTKVTVTVIVCVDPERFVTVIGIVAVFIVELNRIAGGDKMIVRSPEVVTTSRRTPVPAVGSAVCSRDASSVCAAVEAYIRTQAAAEVTIIRAVFSYPRARVFVLSVALLAREEVVVVTVFRMKLPLRL
jgi:hypothetical protein